MNDSIVDTLTRHAGNAMSRRGAWHLLGGAALAGAFAAPGLARAGKAGKTRKNRCKPLGEQCRRGAAEICQSQANPAACEAQHAPCCEDFARCRVSAGVECVIAND